jgi:hypothetical protein
MHYSREELLEAIRDAAVQRALDGEDQDGHIDEATQEEVDRIVALAEEPHLSQLLAELNGEQTEDEDA